MPKFKVSDTITLERTWVIEAENEEAALELVSQQQIELRDPEEVEIDNTPYEVEEIEIEPTP